MKGQKSFDENLNQKAYGESAMKRYARNAHTQFQKLAFRALRVANTIV